MRAVSKVRSDEHALSAQALHEHPINELVSGERGKLGSEWQYDDKVDARVDERLGLLGRAEQRFGGALGVQHGGWVAVEGDDDGSAALGLGGELIEHRTVPAVHAVKLADGHGAGLGIPRQVLDAMHDDARHSETSAATSPARARATRRSHSRPSTGNTRGMKA